MLSKRLFRKHYSDELLLAHADGELPLRTDLVVRKHLQICWECRGRLAELESEAESLAKALADTSFLGPEGVARARDRFARFEAQFEERSQPDKRLVLVQPIWLRLGVAAAAVTCLVILAQWTYGRTQPARILAAAQKAESGWNGSQPLVHARLRVEIAEVKPQPRRHVGHVDIWSERERGRFAAHWSDARGALQYALWRPEAGREYMFDASAGGAVSAAAETPGETASLVSLLEKEPNLQRVERMFLQWLGSRRWQPLHLATNVAVFANAAGVVLRAEKVRDERGAAILRLSLERGDGQRRAEVILEIDGETYRPRVERIRLEAGGRTVELSMKLESVEPVSLRELPPRVFEPDIPAKTAEVQQTKEPSPTPAEEAKPVVATVVEHPRLNLEAFDTAQIDADYVIHRAGACLGEPLEVVREAPDRVVVRGLAATPERKVELLKQLSQLSSFALLRSELNTVGDATPQQHPAALPVHRKVYTSSRQLPLQELLVQAFGNERQITEFTNTAVSSSDNAMAHGWALQRLAVNYSAVAGTLRPESRWLVEAMVRDHLDGLRASSRQLRQGFAPLLKLLPGSTSTQGATRATADTSWSMSLHSLFEEMRGVDRLVQALVAGADLEGKSADKAAGELRSQLLQLDNDLEQVDALTKQGFPYEPAAAHLP